MAQSGVGLEKRQCLLQVRVGPVANSCRIAIVFRGTVKRISANEKAEGGWFIGTVSWYNSQLGKLRIVFDNVSDDYIQPDEIDGVDVILLEQNAIFCRL